MKRLFLLRHAKTHPAEPGEEDHDRTLMPRGRDDAARMARHLRAHGLAPERVLVSSAVRTLQTAELALADLRPAVETLDTLYLAPMVRLLAIVHAAPAQAANLMLIGHNPGMEELLCHLAAHLPGGEYPLVLNTGRVRDQWHTMTRTGRSQKLAEHIPEPYIDMHPQDALLCGVKAGELARVTSDWGAVVARVQHGGGIARGSVFMPIHWSGQTASDARVGTVVNPAVDPVSGEPEFKHTPVRIEPFGVTWFGFILSRTELPLREASNWTRVQGKDFVRYELAGRKPFAAAHDWARKLLDVHDDDADWIEVEDKNGGMYRAVHLVDGRIEACLFVAQRADLPARTWLASMFDKEQLEPADRISLLAGRAKEPGIDPGPTVSGMV